MSHHKAVKELQKVVAPKRAAGWFIRHQLWTLGYYDERGQRVELARGDGTTARGTSAVLKAAIKRFREEQR